MSNKVRFFGPIGGNSGYGIAVRNFAKSFSDSNILTKFNFKSSLDQNTKYFVDNLNNYDGDCNIDFYLHAPPWHRHRSSNYKIGYFYWETDRIPDYWSRYLNQVDEIWAPCNLVKEGCVKAGFKGKISVVPTPHEKSDSKENISIPSSFSRDYILSNNVFKFYSIFQWHYRKGPEVLIRAYWNEFSKNDNVILILKVNALNVSGYTVDKIKSDIYSLKRKMNLHYYPPVYVIPEIIPIDHINALHDYCDCYVSPHRGEGWGMPIHEAILNKNATIVTRYGGISEYLNDNSSYIINHRLTSVSNMEWSPHLYKSNQRWAEPDIDSLSSNMRSAYSNRSLLLKKVDSALSVSNRLSISYVSNVINKKIRDI